MNVFWDVMLTLAAVLISGPGLVCLLWLVIFSGPGVLDGLPDPADKNEGDLLKED